MVSVLALLYRVLATGSVTSLEPIRYAFFFCFISCSDLLFFLLVTCIIFWHTFIIRYEAGKATAAGKTEEKKGTSFTGDLGREHSQPPFRWSPLYLSLVPSQYVRKRGGNGRTEVLVVGRLRPKVRPFHIFLWPRGGHSRKGAVKRGETFRSRRPSRSMLSICLISRTDRSIPHHSSTHSMSLHTTKGRQSVFWDIRRSGVYQLGTQGREIWCPICVISLAFFFLAVSSCVFTFH